jgi:hypothetical protein
LMSVRSSPSSPGRTSTESSYLSIYVVYSRSWRHIPFEGAWIGMCHDLLERRAILS